MFNSFHEAAQLCHHLLLLLFFNHERLTDQGVDSLFLISSFELAQASVHGDLLQSIGAGAGEIRIHISTVDSDCTGRATSELAHVMSTKGTAALCESSSQRRA